MRFILFVGLFLGIYQAEAQHSVARLWNEVLLDAIRNDYARPTVHARNLFHISAAMYDAWAIYDDTSQPFFLGSESGLCNCPVESIPKSEEVESARHEAMSYAAFRLIKHRFRNSPGKKGTMNAIEELMRELGYSKSVSSTDYKNGSPARLGNYLAECIIRFGLEDGSNEARDYQNRYYVPTNEMLVPNLKGNPDISDPNRWQPLAPERYVDQSGNETIGEVPPFLSPEWGRVVPFSLKKKDLDIYNRDGSEFWVYHDPGPPPLMDTLDGSGLSDEYRWGFALVSIWSSHLDPSDSVMWDISPASIGNTPDFPNTIEGYREYYKFLEGGDPSHGHRINPYTGKPYEPQIVPRADYARVLAEFWADGPDSETPPGHWFTILNYVSDHPAVEKRIGGTGEEVSDLEWDVKSYFALGGAMHDAAISAWSVKGWYDYVRPISALRYMSEQGQSHSPDLPNYSPFGLPIIEGYIEQIEGSSGLGQNPKNRGKMKLYTWRGHYWIDDPKEDVAGVGWILADDWWPYQRPTFITPPFAGYVSGHSTYSRAAAVIMTNLTGDEFFPGGMGEFFAKKDEFLVFENGPSVDVTLQWATYKDASDQTSLSRIWGGIHPPADDIPGRIIGEQVGQDAFQLAMDYFLGQPSQNDDLVKSKDQQ